MFLPSLLALLPFAKSRKPAAKRSRLADAKIIHVGHDHMLFRDLYVNLLTLRWTALLLLIGLFYLLINLIFAALYYENIVGIDHARTFADVFFFSVQTMATIGYGYMAPVTVATNILTTIEALVGFIYFAFIAGLMFTKFSRPTAHVLFSEVAIISNYQGQPHLKLRLANKRANRIVDATARLFLLRHEITQEGFSMRTFVDLKLLRDHMPVLRLTWTLMHPIDDSSPLFGVSPEEMIKSTDEMFVTIVGLDETLSQTIHARHSYVPEEILRDVYFEDVLKRNDHSIELNFAKFHMTRAGRGDESALDDHNKP